MRQQISPWLQLGIITASVFLSVLDIFIVNVSLPAIRAGLQGSEGDMQLIIALYLSGYASLLIVAGRVGDLYGRRSAFVYGMVAFTLLSSVCGMAQTSLQLNIARLLQGMSAAWMMPQGIAYLQVLFPDYAPRVRAMGIYGSVAGTASVLGQWLGGVLPDLLGWRWIFWVNLPLGVAAAWMAWKWLPPAVAAVKEKADYGGAVLVTVALMSIIYPLVQGREQGWPLWSGLMLLAGVILSVLFVLDQRRKLRLQRPLLLDLRLFRYHDFNRALCVALCYFMVQDTYFLVHAVYLQTGLGWHATQVGLLFVSQGIGYVLASLVGSRLMPKYGARVPFVGVSIMLTGLALHAWYFSGVHAHGWLWLILFYYGVGCGSVLPALMTLALQHIPAQYAGAASGMYTTFQQTAIALGICVVGGVFFEVAGRTGWLAAYQWTMSLSMSLLFLVGLGLWRIQRTKGY